MLAVINMLDHICCSTVMCCSCLVLAEKTGYLQIKLNVYYCSWDADFERIYYEAKYRCLYYCNWKLVDIGGVFIYGYY